ncbi:armadillo repeat-containing protein 2 [Nephila pilipes]|uniref:Armadillo repeat-containing protein 2 n=1 Tax=Nephila pilipes TaxID=299642 RepID=A0A8X6NBF0_NEPPI|nr:armadillo repeat-containing protein 2 [Nephila pilipes]
MEETFQKNSYFPFYAHPMDQKRSVKIIKEVKAEIKKIESRRPSSPFTSRSIQSALYSELKQPSRPSSCSSIKSLKYEPEESFNLPSRRLSPILSQKIVDADVKLEPIVTKPIFTNRRGSNTNMKALIEKSLTVFPPLPYEEKISSYTAKSLSGSLEKLDICPTSQNSLLTNNASSIHDTKYSSFEVESSASCGQRSSSSIVPNNDRLNDKKEEKAIQQLSDELTSLLPSLEKYIRLGNKKKEEDAVFIVKNIYAALEKRNAFLLMFESRLPLLKLLFKLLDTNFPVLSLHIVKLLLEMKIKDKNLCNIIRLITKLVKDQDVDLRKYQLIDPITEVIYNTSVGTNCEAVVNGLRILRTLMTKQKFDVQQKEKCVFVLFHHLMESNSMLSSNEKFDGRYEEVIYVIMIFLKHLLEDKISWKFFIEMEHLTELLKGLKYSQNIQNVNLITCLISKIVDEEDGCLAMAQCSNGDFQEFLSLLEAYRYDVDVTLQIAFIIGNLVSVNENIALAFVKSANFLSVLIVLGEYISEHIQFKESVSDCFKSEKFRLACGDRNLRQDIFEVVLKILCIFANICLHSNAGSCLAKQSDILSNLLAIIRAYAERDSVSETKTVLHSFLVIIGNISYYLESNSELCIKTTTSVTPFLDDCFSFEVRLEAAHVLRNVTRSSEVREYIQEHNFLPALIKLLNEDDKDFRFVAYGIVMNILIDESSHQIFYEEEGVTKIIHTLHLCADRDWKTCAVLCQILWNYFKRKNGSALISKMEIQHLIKYLSYAIYNEINEMKNDNSDYHNEWKRDFCPVAMKLLDLLRNKNSTDS